MNWGEKSVLITGGTGSLGKALCRRILGGDVLPRRLIVLSRDEQKQFQMAQEFPEDKFPMRYFIGDVRDYDRLYRAFQGVNYVIPTDLLYLVILYQYL